MHAAEAVSSPLSIVSLGDVGGGGGVTDRARGGGSNGETEGGGGESEADGVGGDGDADDGPFLGAAQRPEPCP